MRIRELFRWAFWSTLLGELAFLSTQFLPGRPRERMPPPSEDIYRRADLEQEFSKAPLPSKILISFEKAVSAHLEGGLQKALDLYFGLVLVDRDGSEVFLSEQSAVVAYNVYLVYEAAGPQFMEKSDHYLKLYYKLLEEATG